MRFVRLGAAAEIDSDVAALETAVVGPKVRGVHLNPQAQQAAPQETERRLNHLYELMIAPLETSITGAHRLLIVPDGKLTLAPLDAFIDAQGHYLLQRYVVSYLGSFRDLYRKESASNKTRPSLVVANPDFNAVLPNYASTPAPKERPQFEPLPGAELEANDVRQALHITPDRVLAGQSGARKVAAICRRTGDSALRHAQRTAPQLEGSDAGLRFVVDKAGRLFMQYFYAHLDAGPAEGIRLAQLDMVAKSEYKQPNTGQDMPTPVLQP